MLHLLCSTALDAAKAVEIRKEVPYFYWVWKWKWSRSVVSNSARLLCPWDFPGNSTGVGCHFILQAIFQTQGLNQGLLHCRKILYCLRHQGSCISHHYFKMHQTNKNIKPLEEKLRYSWPWIKSFLDITSNAQCIKEKNNTLDLIKIKSLVCSKDTNKNLKSKPHPGKNYW